MAAFQVAFLLVSEAPLPTSLAVGSGTLSSFHLMH